MVIRDRATMEPFYVVDVMAHCLTLIAMEEALPHVWFRFAEAQVSEFVPATRLTQYWCHSYALACVDPDGAGISTEIVEP